MKYLTSVGAIAALMGLAHAVNQPSSVTILTPLNGSSVGAGGSGYMIDVVVEFAPPKGSSSSSSSAGASPTSASAAAATSSSSSSNSVSIGYKRQAANLDDNFFPFLNSINQSSFKPGPNPAAPGMVCLMSTSPDNSTNFAGVFQLNAITNSDASGNILQAYFSWFVGAPSFGVNVNSTVEVFFLNGAAPATYTGDPRTDPNVITNVGTANFFISGATPSNTTAPASMATPLSITVFTPSGGETVGVNGLGWMVDMVIVNNDPAANYFAPSNGYKPLYHDNFTDKAFAPGVVSEALPGLVLLSNTSTFPGGNTTNLANLYQINAITGINSQSIITEYWATWLVGAAFAGKSQPSQLTAFVVNGTAPTHINGSLPTNIISNVVTVAFELSGNTTGTPTSGSGSGTSSPSPSKTGAAVSLAAPAITVLLAAVGFSFLV